MEADRVRPGFTRTTTNHPTGIFGHDLGIEVDKDESTASVALILTFVLIQNCNQSFVVSVK
jgi:hypothetical protein